MSADRDYVENSEVSREENRKENVEVKPEVKMEAKMEERIEENVSKELHGVPMIPYGLLSCRVNGEETRVVELAPEGFRFRWPCKEADTLRIHKIELSYFQYDQSCYETLILSDYQLVLQKRDEFYVVFTIITDDSQYRSYTQNLLLDYGKYIHQKLEESDAELAHERTGYPLDKEEHHVADYEAQLKIWFQKSQDLSQDLTRNLTQNLNENLTQTGFQDVLGQVTEMAISLNTEQWYHDFLTMQWEELQDKYWKTFYLEKHPLTRHAIDRVYLGNQFCHLLFPDKKLLFGMLDKANKEYLKVTLAFSYLRDSEVEKTGVLLDELVQWCKENHRTIEIIINDYGLGKLVRERCEFLIPVLGNLLNKRRKDARMRYKNGWSRNCGLLTTTNLNAQWFQEWISSEYGIERYEYETCGYPIQVANGHHSLSLPFYQTNTSQYCPLYAITRYGDRGHQHSITACPKYCKEHVLLYPSHLNMIGRFNSLFAFDEKAMTEPDYLSEIISHGIDRIVWNLI